MKNRLLKQICFLLAVVLCISMLGACSSKKGPKKPKKTTSDNATASDLSDDVSSVPDDDFTEPEPVEDDPFPEDPGDDFEDNSLRQAEVSVFNQKPVQNNFLGFNAVYHAFAYRHDNFGRTLTPEMADLELERAIQTGIKIARTQYDMGLAWDAKKGAWDWESDDMKALYQWSNKLKEGGVDTWISHWYEKSYFLKTYYWSDKDKNGTDNTVHPGVAAGDDQQAILQKFANFMADTILQMRAHGCTNAKYISIATEPHCTTWRDEWGNDENEKRAYVEVGAVKQAQAINTVHDELVKRNMRSSLSIIGPNYAGTVEKSSVFLPCFISHLKPGAVDQISAHSYNGYKPEDDNYFQWQEKMDEYKAFLKTDNFVWDEYGLAAGQSGIGYRKTAGLYGYQMALADMCFLNNGIQSGVMWTLFDQQWPNNNSNGVADAWDDGIHQWGCMPSLTRSSLVYPYFHYVALVGNIMGQQGAKVYAGDDEALDGVYAAMTVGPDGSYNIMVINTDIEPVNLTLNFEKSLGGATLYRHVYDPNNAFATADTKLTAPDKKIINTNQVLKDQVISYGVYFYTTRQVCK